jgi:hypothetical protein
MLMDRDQSSSTDSIVSYDEIQDNGCCGIDCNNVGTHILLIALVNRVGYFCEKCKLDLERNELIKHELPSRQFTLSNQKQSTKRD